MLLTAVGIICDTRKIDPSSTSVNNAVEMLLTAVGIICDTRKIDTLSTSVNNVLPASVAQLDAPSDWRPGGRGFNPRRATFFRGD